MSDLKQKLFLIADEMRGMAGVGKHYALNVYEVERADRIGELAIEVAALADEDHTPAEIKTIFDDASLLHVSPAIGVDALVLNAREEILLIRRKDNQKWAMPGGLAEIGMTLPELALKELWEEAGMRGEVKRLLGMFDGRLWGSTAKVHLINVVFQVQCDDLTPAPGIESLDAQFFARDHLPEAMHGGHSTRVPKCFELLDSGNTYFDPAASAHIALSMHQRPPADHT